MNIFRHTTKIVLHCQGCDAPLEFHPNTIRYWTQPDEVVEEMKKKARAKGWTDSGSVLCPGCKERQP